MCHHHRIGAALVLYAGGRWSATPFKAHYGRFALTTAMLTDGRFFVGGGEYVSDANGNALIGCSAATCPVGPPDQPDPAERSHCELFDPSAASGVGAWIQVPDYPNSTSLADGLTAPLPNGKLLVAAAYSMVDRGTTCPCLTSGDRCINGVCRYIATGFESMIFDPSNLASPWSTARSIDNAFGFGEGSFTLLQDGRILLAEKGGEVFSPSTSLWSKLPTWAPQNPFNGEGGLRSPSTMARC
jgi:hypothetical protein